MKYSDHDTRVKAKRRSARLLRDRFPSRWREAGKTEAGADYPAGVWPGDQVGKGIHVAPERCISTHAVRVRAGKRGTTLEGRFLVRDEGGSEREERNFSDAKEEQEPVDVRRERTATDVDPS